MNLEMQEFHAAFFEEAGERLAELEDGLMRLETDSQDPELINLVFRAAHSIKGTGAALGFSEVASFTHHLETVLDEMRQERLEVSSARIELLLQATDALGSLIESSKDGTSPNSDIDSIVDALQADLKSEPSSRERPSEVEDSFAIFEDSSPSPTAQAADHGVAKSTNTHSDSIRVNVSKIEELINLVGELVIANSMVQQSYGSQENNAVHLREALGGMDRTTRQLQERVMAVRLVPIASLFRRFPRIVRDLSAFVGKDVSLDISGHETELDKQVIEEIGDPLTHLLRNAVDHGLETPEDRIAAGKPATGRVSLRAFHEGGNVIIEIEDDGRGINTARVREKGIAQGFISAEDNLSEERIHELILLPGFSTAQQVTSISGRGVGMDVVKQNVEALNGTIGIRSRPGLGATFSIRLPLTMAIMDGLALRLQDAVYILPMLSVIESIRPTRKQLMSTATGKQLVIVRGEPLPLLDLAQLFNASTSLESPCDGLVVIVEHQGNRFGIVVEELIGQLQVVMKSLEANYERVEGLSGATILGDGRIAMILDIAGLLRLAAC